jgi:hypothetical protein
VLAVAGFLLLAMGTLTVGLYYALGGRSAVPRAPVALIDDEERLPALAEALGEEGTLRIEVLSLERLSTGVVELRLAITHVGAEPTPLDIAQRFSVDDPDRGTLAEVYLADLGHQRKVFVLRDADGEPIGSRDDQPLQPRERRVLWARFPAPAEGQREVVVHVPHAEPMPNVPVQDLVTDEGSDDPGGP